MIDFLLRIELIPTNEWKTLLKLLFSKPEKVKFIISA